MDEKIVREYYDLTDEFATLLCGMKWIDKEKYTLNFESIIKQSEKLWRKFLAFGVNKIGLCEE